MVQWVCLLITLRILLPKENGECIVERYNKIEYGFEEKTDASYRNESVSTTDKDGYITSQRYVNDSDRENSGNQTNDGVEEQKNVKPKRRKEKDVPRENVLIFQLTVCILLAIAAYVIKSIGGELYRNVRDFYYTNLNNSIIIEMDNDRNDQFVSDLINEAETKQN